VLPENPLALAMGVSKGRSWYGPEVFSSRIRAPTAYDLSPAMHQTQCQQEDRLLSILQEYQTGHTYTARSTDVSSIGTVQPLLLSVNFNLDFLPDLRRRTECRWMNDAGDVLRGKVTIQRFLQAGR